MAKFDEPFEDTQELFNTKIAAAGLAQNVVITLVINNTAKEVFKVVKTNDLFKHRSGDDVLIVLNDKIFDQLTDDQKSIVADEAVAEISYDLENDKVVITKPQFVAHDSVLDRYGYDELKIVRESIKSLYDVEKQKADEEKSLKTKRK